MKLAIMQPYFLPYIGYFQLINAVDEFILYDNIEYTKKGSINRNRLLNNGLISFFTIPLKKDSDFLHVNRRTLADIWPVEREKILNRIRESYRKAPEFTSVYRLIETCFTYSETNLYLFVLNSIILINRFIGISTPIIPSSSIPIDHGQKSEGKVISLCKARNATTYINPIGGVSLYSKERFMSEGIDLKYLKANAIEYKQFEKLFEPALSIIDVLMFNSKGRVKTMLHAFTLI